MQYAQKTDFINRRILCRVMLVGFIVGLLLMNLGKKVLFENSDILSEYTLTEMKYSPVDKNAFFFYLLRKRVGLILILAVLSTTWMGVATAWTGAAWLGISFGMLVMTSVMRYGIKGLLLVGTGIFPQILVYFPVALILLQWSHEFFTVIYYPEKFSGMQDSPAKKLLLRKKVLQFFCLVGVVIIGCVLESYVNPILVLNLLKFF